MTANDALQMLAEIEDLLRTSPGFGGLDRHDDETLEWVGRAAAVVRACSPADAVAFDMNVGMLGIGTSRNSQNCERMIRTTLFQLRFQLRQQTTGAMTAAIEKGAVFGYFDEIRKKIEEARSDLLFVDPYLDAEFVSRYLPQVAPGVTIRLLAQVRLSTLLPAVESFCRQFGTAVEVRSAPGFHDRYMFVDRCACFQSGASFKDGAKKAPTTLTQITDAFEAVRDTYEKIWSSATRSA